MSPARQLRDGVSGPPARRARGPRCVQDDAVAHVSPARELQTALMAELATEDDDVRSRWPGAVRLCVIGGGSLGLWCAIIAGVHALG